MVLLFSSHGILSVKMIFFLTGKIYNFVCEVFLDRFLEGSDRVSAHKNAQNISFQTKDFTKYPAVLILFGHKSKHFRYQMYMSLESGRTNIFIIKKCTATKLSLKIRTVFWDTRYNNAPFKKPPIRLLALDF